MSTFWTYKWLKFKFSLGKNSIWKQPKIRQKYGDSYIFKLWLEVHDFSDIWNFLCKKQNDSKLGVIGSGLSLLSYIVRLICQFLFYRWIWKNVTDEVVSNSYSEIVYEQKRWIFIVKDVCMRGVRSQFKFLTTTRSKFFSLKKAKSRLWEIFNFTEMKKRV